MRTLSAYYTLCLAATTVVIICLVDIIPVPHYTTRRKHQGEPLSDFKAWKKGLITKAGPESPRNCSKLFNGDPFEIRRQKSYMSRWKSSFKDSDLLVATSNCSWVDDYFSNNLYITKLEKSFPIAFTFLIHNSPQQVMRLLRVLYRPHNQHCIALDLKSSTETQEIFKNLAKCLGNVHIVSQLREVRWGHKSIMESQMQCSRDLLAIRQKQIEQHKWKYIINLCGKELPLNTNHDIVSHLIKLNGTSAINARKVVEKKFLVRLNKTLPSGIQLYVSPSYMSLSFKFVHYLTTNYTTLSLFNFFSKNCLIPEEHYYSSVYMFPGVPGGFNPELPKNAYFVNTQSFWRFERHFFLDKYSCSGEIIHEVCVVDVGDMLRIKFGGNVHFHNKYFMENDHVIMDCFEEQVIAKNKLEFLKDN